MGLSPDEIVYHHPSITLADVYVLLSCYHDHLEEIRQEIVDDEIFAEQTRAKMQSLVQAKLKKMHGK